MWKKNDLTGGWQTFGWGYTVGHRTAKWEYFITKHNWNPEAPLSRDQFDLTPFATIQGNNAMPCSNGSFSVPMPHSNPSVLCTDAHRVYVPTDRSGYHVILAVWTIGDTANAFYNVIDVNLINSNTTPTPTEPPVTTPEAEVNTPIFDNERISLATAVNGTSLVEPSGDSLVLWSQRLEDSQVWRFMLDKTADTYTIQNVADGRYLTEANNTATLTTNFTTGSSWRVFLSTNNTYQILNALSGRSLDVEGGNKSANGTRVITWTRNSNKSANQRWHFNITPEFIPSSPSHLHTMGEVRESHVDLMWGAVPGSQHYEIYRGYHSDEMRQIGTSTTERYLDDTAQAGIMYVYNVRAINTLGQSSTPSNTLTVNVPAAIVTPPTEPPVTPPSGSTLSPPVHLRITDETLTSISLAWDAPANAAQDKQYEIFRDQIKIADVGGHVLTYTDTGLAPGTSHSYTVRIYAASEHSNPTSGTTSPIIVTPPTEPPVTTPSSGLTFRITGEGTARQNLSVTNRTGTNIPSGWKLQLTYTGGIPTLEWPATWIKGSGGNASTTVNNSLNNNATVTIPISVSANTRISNVIVNSMTSTQA